MKIFNDVAALQAASLTTGQICSVKEVGEYKINSSGASGLTIANSNVATPVASGTAVNVKQFGAVGDGVTDDTAAIQAAIDAVYANGGGTVFVSPTNAFYRTTAPLRIKPKVSLVGDASRPKVKNTTSAGGVGTQDVLLVGNFHPDFTEELVYKDCGTVAKGYTVTLTTPSEASAFSVGDQVLVSSNATGTTGTFTIPQYMYLNIITDISGAVITLREPIDESFAGGIEVISGYNGRNYPLWFAQDSRISDLTLEATNYHWSGADSAALNVTYERLTTFASSGVYGNSFQRCRFNDLDCYFWASASEMSHNTLKTKVQNCNFYYQYNASVSVGGGLTSQEFARDVVYDNCVLDFGATSPNNYLIRTISARNVWFKNLNASCVDASGSFTAVQISTTTESWNANDVVVSDCKFTIDQCTRFIEIDGQTAAGNDGNRVVNCTFSGTATASDSVRILDAIRCHVKDCYMPDGNASFSASSTGCEFTGNYIEDGFANDGGNTDSDYQLNVITNNSSRKWKVKNALKLAKSNAEFTGNTTTEVVYDVDIGDAILRRDTITFEILADAQGNSDNRVYRFYFYDNGTTAETDICSITMAAAEFGRHSIELDVYFAASYMIYDYTHVKPAGTVVGLSNQVTTINIAGDWSLRVECASLGANTTVNTRNIGVRVKHPRYGVVE